MKMRVVLLISTVFMLLSIPVVYGYSDPVSITLIWQFLASILVGLAFFYKSIKLWVVKTFFKDKKEK
jgi:hypothetical protein